MGKKFKGKNMLIACLIGIVLMGIGCGNGDSVATNTGEESVEGGVKEEEKVIQALNPNYQNIQGLNYNILGDGALGKSIVFQNKYTELEGITTFRGNQYRTSPSYGVCNVTEGKLNEAWKFTTSSSSWGGGAGWTGQPSIVKWPEEIKNKMNIKDEFKQKKDFTEVIYSSLDGNIYFLDMESGKPSRDKIKVGNPIKGSLTIDPRGIPLLYVGEGIDESNVVGFNIYSLIDGKKLYEVNGGDKDAYRGWPAFDSSSLIHGETDTVILGGENGMLYLIKLNSNYNKGENSISINPQITKYRYKAGENIGRLGIENSVAIYSNLVYFGDNNGYIHCIDLNTLKPVWMVNGGDDIDASLTLEVEGETPYIYCGTEVDHQGVKGKSTIRKINGLTGEIAWQKEFQCESIIGDHATNGGLLATNVVGKKELDNIVVFSLARYKGFNKGATIAMDKKTGEIIWETPFDNYMWSSPVDFYDENGKGYLIQCDSAGYMGLLDGKTGKILNKVLLNGNVESTPAIFNDTVVVATRNGTIYGIKIK